MYHYYKRSTHTVPMLLLLLLSHTGVLQFQAKAVALPGRELCVSVSGDLSVGVCNKEQPYALVDAEAGIFLIYSLF
jgi:hypothetical protein